MLWFSLSSQTLYDQNALSLEMTFNFFWIGLNLSLRPIAGEAVREVLWEYFCRDTTGSNPLQNGSLVSGFMSFFALPPFHHHLLTLQVKRLVVCINLAASIS